MNLNNSNNYMPQNGIIAAISTPQGIGGIAVVRLSGTGSIGLVDRFYESPVGKKLADRCANTVHFGSIVDGDETIDEVLVSVFHSPHSFTGEESAEISCHGSLYIQQRILRLFVDNGASLAKAGEFTQRAFTNGKMDLAQAESVADLIAANSAATHRLALNQLKGGISSRLADLRGQLLNFTSLVELELDFSEEDVKFADRDNLKELARKIEEHITVLADSFQVGNAIKSGIPVAIVGETNVGKSTLLNTLLQEEKSIVSDIHGTTRDAIEDILTVNGIVFRLIDTAGIRETVDEIESIGIDRTFKKLEQASIVLWLVDSTADDVHIVQFAEKVLPYITSQKLILVFNKVDIVGCGVALDRKRTILQAEIPVRVFISAKYDEGVTGLKQALLNAAGIPEIGEQDVIVSNIRHYEALKKAQQAVRRVVDGLEMGISSDFLSQDIRECLYYLGEITGQISVDEILGNIFSKFCIGK